MSGNHADVDVLFVHVPKFCNEYLPLGDFINITYMPMGFLALAEKARRLGYSVEVVHLGVEWMKDPTYSLARELSSRKARAVLMPLYWHYQTYDTIQVAQRIKEVSPDTRIVLGGLTASYFAQEILRNFTCIDAVQQGHGEPALPMLLREIMSETPSFDTVPFLHYRDATGQVRKSPNVAFATPESLNDLVFADFSLMRNAATYISSFGFPLAFSKEYRKEENLEHQTMGRTFFPLCTGRGCPTACTYCGGNRKTLAAANGRNRLLWRDHDKVLDDIRRALDHGYRTMSLCFDPVPQHDDYYVELFQKIRTAKLPTDFYFENWGIPTPRFLEEFSRTFAAPHSYMALSPDSANEGIRRRNKGFFYTNDELRQTLSKMNEQGIQVDVFFTLALSGETLREAYETRDMITEFREKYENIRRLMTWSVQLEPGSPQYEDPAAHGIITDRHGFMDFYRAHGGPHADTYSSLGFKILNYFGDARDNGDIRDFERHIQHLKCMDFCFLSADPRQKVTPLEGRMHCLERRRKIAERRGVTTEQRVIDDAHRYDDAAEAMRAWDAAARPDWL